MGKKQNTLPGTLYAHVQRDGDDSYIMAGWAPEDLGIGIEDQSVVGEYRLVKTYRAKGTLLLQEQKQARRTA